METQQNNISSQAMLSAIVGMMFCAPFVKNNIKNDPDFSGEEKDFIMWYVQVWFINLVFLVIVLIAAIINVFWVQSALSRIVKIWSFAVYIVTIFSLFACINNLTMWKSDEKLVTNIQNKRQILKAYIPILNFISWFRQEDYNKPYRRLKESTLLRSIFIFWTLLIGNSFGIWVLIIIGIRIILLMLNVDIIPLSIKKAINSMFLCNTWEISAYLFSPIVSKFRNANYETVLHARKQSYTQWQNFWAWIIVQYVIFILILYFIHRNNIWIYWAQSILLLATILWIARIVIFYKYKKTFLKIPILSEIISLVLQ